MNVVRRFLVAPSLVRLIRKERGGTRISEGYFAPQAGRTSFVRIDGQQCHLVLVNNGSSEERTEVPRAHGDALLDVCAGKALYDRTTVSVGGAREATIDRYTVPSGLDLISISFDDEAGAQAFRPPAWFGNEVSDDEAYERHAIALQGVPSAGEVSLTNAALDAVLDLIEPRFGFSRNIASAPTPRREETTAAPAAAKPVTAPPAQETAPPSASGPAAGAKPAESKPADTKPADAKPTEAPPVAKEPEGNKSDEPKPEEPKQTAKSAAAKSEEAKESDNNGPEAKGSDAKSASSATAEGKPAAEAASAKGAPSSSQEPEKGDARIDDVIESLSQALGAAIQKPQPPAREDELAASFERWTVRPRRN